MQMLSVVHMLDDRPHSLFPVLSRPLTSRHNCGWLGGIPLRASPSLHPISAPMLLLDAIVQNYLSFWSEESKMRHNTTAQPFWNHSSTSSSDILLLVTGPLSQIQLSRFDSVKASVSAGLQKWGQLCWVILPQKWKIPFGCFTARSGWRRTPTYIHQ
jgi:hypothetical protein